jgi:predicted ATPase
LAPYIVSISNAEAELSKSAKLPSSVRNFLIEEKGLMENELTIQTVYKSITGLHPVKLPPFVVLTGLNGSGKSHLLTAIAQGAVRSSLAPNYTNDVRLFTAETIVPKDTGSFDPYQNRSQQASWFNAVRTVRAHHEQNALNQAIQLGIPSRYCGSTRLLQTLTVERLSEVLSDPTRAPEVAESLQRILQSAGQNIGQQAINQNGDQTWRTLAQKLIASTPGVFLSANEYEFFRNDTFRWGVVDPFQQAFGQVFTTYRDLMQSNTLLKEYPAEGERHLTREEFEKEYGVPPWDFVNQILEECKLDFRIDRPALHDKGSYEPQLRKLTSNIEMRFADLSSGEKVLMSFALCLYNTRETRQLKRFPTLLLLDEVDGPLHPSMTSSLLGTIQNVLVKSKNVAVIMTTHSPSTVAMSPDESIYAMNPSGPSIDKTSKSRALSILTHGVPTLSVAFDGRRQVFVESHADAAIYDSLYQLLRPSLNSERSLVFLEVGHKDSSGNAHNSGCAQVKRLVKELNLAGNRSVLGLVDWDGKQHQDGRLHVLSPGIRNGIESALFDPVLLAALVIREKPTFAVQQGLLTAEEHYPMTGWSEFRWQQCVEVIQTLILEPSGKGDALPVTYLSGMTINVSRAYLHMDDHALEASILDKLPFLKSQANGAGRLMQRVCDTVLRECQGLLPQDLLVTFNGLLSAEFETDETHDAGALTA